VFCEFDNCHKIVTSPRLSQDCRKIVIRSFVNLGPGFVYRLIMNTPLRRSGMARVLKASVFPAHPRSSANVMNHTCLCPPSFSWSLFTDPGGMEGWVGLGRWLHIEINDWHRELNPDTVTHLSTNRARRRLTSFIETNVLRQPATGWRQMTINRQLFNIANKLHHAGSVKRQSFHSMKTIWTDDLPNLCIGPQWWTWSTPKEKEKALPNAATSNPYNSAVITELCILLLLAVAVVTNIITTTTTTTTLCDQNGYNNREMHAACQCLPPLSIWSSSHRLVPW